MNANTPFRACDYCRRTDKPTRRSPRHERRAWTVFHHSRKIACPDCWHQGRAEDDQVHRIVMRFGTLLSHRLLAEPMALYGVEHDVREQR